MRFYKTATLIITNVFLISATYASENTYNFGSCDTLPNVICPDNIEVAPPLDFAAKPNTDDIISIIQGIGKPQNIDIPKFSTKPKTTFGDKLPKFTYSYPKD